jgi:hypothetical protein
MKKFATWLTALLLIATCSTAFAGNGNATKAVGNLGNPGVAPPQSMPYGRSYTEWSMAWWQYAIPKPLDVNPFGYGTDGTFGQSGPVWFLGGTFTGVNTTREITVPAGIALFFPVMDVECSTIEGGDFHGSNDAELRACAKGWADRQGAGEFGQLFCKVDGVELKNLTEYRFATPLMYFILQEMAWDNNIFFVPVAEGQEVYSVGDGYYIMLKPLPVGTHTLEFPFIHYTINVAPHS